MRKPESNPDPVDLAKTLTELAERSQRVAQDFFERQAKQDKVTIPDPGVVGDAFAKLCQALLADPGRLMQAQLQWWQQMGELWQHGLRRAAGGQERPLAEPDPADRRFKDEAWSEQLVFDYIKQSYLLAARWIQGTVAEVDTLDAKTKSKVEFYTRQFVDAMAPSNFVLTNPAALKQAAETNGESLISGLRHLLQHL